MKKIISILAGLAVSAASVFAFNLEIDASFYVKPYSTVRGSSDEYTLKLDGYKWSTSISGADDLNVSQAFSAGFSDSFILYFLYPCSWLDLGVNISSAVDFGYSNVDTHLSGVSEDDSVNASLSWKIGPAAAFNLTDKHTFFASTTWGFDAIGAKIKAKHSGDSADIYYGGIVATWDADLGYRYYFKKTKNCLVGLNAGAYFSFPIGGFVGFGAESKVWSNHTGYWAQYDMKEAITYNELHGFACRLYGGITFNIGRRGLDRK